ncbi:MAG: outer membrane protein assembly factor [Flavipsychrobacter sp.]|nr:outer membrane protein assembly factor [Flavipsychrobacter sp.]
MYNTFLRYSLFFCCLFFSAFTATAQLSGGNTPQGPVQKTYEIGGITVVGTQYVDADILTAVSSLNVGDKIKLPHDESIARAIRILWKQELFSNVAIQVERIVGDKVFLQIVVEERPRLSKFNFRGIKKSEAEDLKDKVALVSQKVVTDAIKQDAVVRIRNYYADKGYGNVNITVRERKDTLMQNAVILNFDIIKGTKTKINQVNIYGNENATDMRLKRTLKSTKEMARVSLERADESNIGGMEKRSFGKYLAKGHFLSISKTLEALDPYFRYNFFSSSKFNAVKFDTDKEALVDYYNTLGFRDAAIEKDTVYTTDIGHINIDIHVREGRKYYFGDMEWRGNTKYSSERLTQLLGIKKGDVYNLQLLETRIGRQMSPDGGVDVSSLYMDDGYLFFSIDPIESSIEGDTINFELRVTEGPQATIKNVTITGNDKTNEHVIRRELRTLPGDKFSREALIRSQREIANLNFFDQEKIGIQPKPNPQDGTVDIEYSLVERSSDQLQLSAGFGGGVRFYGNIGVSFSNFSMRNIFRPKYWDPLPVGDGQKFSVNYQSNGAYFNSFSTSFTEPWLGGKKPNALTTSFIYSRYSGVTAPLPANSSFLRMAGGGVSLSRRLKWPDDNFIFTYGVNYNNYRLKEYALVDDFRNGYSNNLFLKLVLARVSVNSPLYPTSGSNINFTFQVTPPFSSFSGRDYSNETSSEKYKWIEYHKYRFTADWYQTIAGKLVFKLSTKYGFLGYYNSTIGFSPFERFQLGGDGLSGYSFFIGRDIISQRGYRVYAQNATIFNKYSAELRYPLSLNPSSTIFALAFVDAANAWGSFKEYNPFKLNRDAGVGIRVFLPMFGLLGLDYGIGFDKYNQAAGLTRMKNLGTFTFMLGFEPD